MSHNKNAFWALMPLYMVILIDIMGIVLVLPVLTPLILQASSGMVPAGVSTAMRDFLYGFLLSLYPLFMFFSTPILGDLSDKFGRKTILLICMIVGAFSYILSAYAVIHHSLVLLLIGRSIAGLVAGTQSIASAAIIDLSTAKTKTRNLSWVVFVSSIGVVIGPLLGGITSEEFLFGAWSYAIPFVLSGFLGLLNAVFLVYYYQDTHQVQSQQKIHLTKGFRLFLSAFSEKKFSLLAFALFGFSLGWSLYYQAVTWFFMESFHYTSAKLGLFIGFLGVISAIGTSVVAKVVLKIFNNEKAIFCISAFLMAIANFASGMSSNELAQWLWVILNGTAEVLCFTLSLSLFSNLVGEESQGWIMGVVGSIGGITWTVGGLISGPLGYINIHVPMLTAGFLCLLSFAIMLYLIMEPQRMPETHSSKT